MLSIVTHLRQQYEEALPYADPRSRDWFLVNSDPFWCNFLSVAYLLFVWLGPKVMKSRPAFKITGTLVIYNFLLVLLSLYMLVEIILSARAADYSVMCQPYNDETRKNPKELRMAQVLWWYYFSKAIELLDTVLMVLRKKNDQITFLHVFHHFTMLQIWWWVMMFIPGGCSYFGACLNCSVHVVMYAYYGMSAIPSLRRHLWWKKYLTKFQLIQFCFTLTHTLTTIYNKCDFPVWGKKLLAGYMIIMLVLFSNFYLHAYLMKKRRPKDNIASQSGASKTEIANSYTNGVSNGLKRDVSNGVGYASGEAYNKKAI